MDKVSVTMTTCGRLDLLKRTIDSFHETNSYPIDEFIIVNDDPESSHILNELYGDKYTIINNDINYGQTKSLDIVFNSCVNEYIFHLEDDWFFDLSNDYIQDSITILKGNENIHQVWVRHEYDNPHKTIGNVIITDGVRYRLVDPNFNNSWNGYSWNPGLRRKSDHIKMFPNGISAFKDELACAIHTKNFNYKTVLLDKTCCYHIGYNRTTH